MIKSVLFYIKYISYFILNVFEFYVYCCKTQLDYRNNHSTLKYIGAIISAFHTHIVTIKSILAVEVYSNVRFILIKMFNTCGILMPIDVSCFMTRFNSFKCEDSMRYCD